MLRGGYGTFFEQENTDGRVNNNMVPFRLDETGINDLTQRRTMADFFNGKPLTTSAAPTIGATPTSMKMGRNHHFNFGVQHQLSRSTVLELNYVGNVGQYLNGSTNINIPTPAAGGVQARRPYPQFGNINYFDTNMSNTYHSLQASLARRAAGGLWYMASYTWSKSITTQNLPAVGGNTGREKSISGFDIPQNLAVSAGWELPVGRGKRYLGDAGGVTQALLGGWQMQAILILRSGRPFTPTIGADRANTGVGGAAAEPHRVRGARRPDGREVVRPHRVRAARAVHLRRLGRQHPARGLVPEPRLLGVQALRRPPGVPRGVLQPDEHAELQRAGHRDRRSHGGPRDEHAQHAPPVPVRLEVQFLIRPSTEAIA